MAIKLMTMKDVLYYTNHPATTSRYVLVKESKKDSEEFKRLIESNHLKYIKFNLYQCPRTIANYMGWTVISEWPLMLN